RHTRSKRDWSSDVCSSDLGAAMMLRILPITPMFRPPETLGGHLKRRIDPTLSHYDFIVIIDRDVEVPGSFWYLGKKWPDADIIEIGRASCRERGYSAVWAV